MSKSRKASPAKSAPLDKPSKERPGDLELDRKNPRFGGDDVPAGKKGEALIVRRLIDHADLKELIESIAVNGYLDLEPLFVVEEGRKKVVIEGNRRLAAVKLLSDPELAAQVNITVPAISKNAADTLKEIHVIILKTRTDGRQLIGFKHINGTHKWDSYAKGRFAADWYRDEHAKGTTLQEIAKSLGDRHDTVLRLVQGVFVLDQAHREGLFDPDDRFPGRVFFFSHLYTALTRTEFRIFLDLPKQWRDLAPRENPVPVSALPKLRELLNWLYGSREEEQPPIINSQNPDLKILGEVISADASLQRLRVDRDLKKAYEWSGARTKQFAEHLIKGLSNLEQAAALTYVYRKDTTVREAAENIVDISKQIFIQIKLKDEEIKPEDASDNEDDGTAARQASDTRVSKTTRRGK